METRNKIKGANNGKYYILVDSWKKTASILNDKNNHVYIYYLCAVSTLINEITQQTVHFWL